MCLYAFKNWDWHLCSRCVYTCVHIYFSVLSDFILTGHSLQLPYKFSHIQNSLAPWKQKTNKQKTFCGKCGLMVSVNMNLCKQKLSSKNFHILFTEKYSSQMSAFIGTTGIRVRFSPKSYSPPRAKWHILLCSLTTYVTQRHVSAILPVTTLGN